MTVSVLDLQDFVRSTNPDDLEFVLSCLQQAQALVTQYNKVWDSESEGYVASAAPESVVDRAVLECASELFHKRNAPNGIAQFAAFDGTPIRVARDPMVAAYALLNPYLVVGF